MKRHIWIGILASFGLAFFFVASVKYSGGPPEGYTGSPADGKNCSACHASSPKTLSDAITTNIPPGGYVPGDTYSVTVSIVDSNAMQFGFQLSPQDLSGNLLGELISTSNETQVTSSKKYIEHTFTGTLGSISRSWSFQWVAPPAGTGDVTFYAAINAANGNGSTTGDQVYLTNLTVSEMVTAIESSLPTHSKVRITILPGTTWLRVSSSISLNRIEVYTIDGRNVYVQDIGSNREVLLQLPESLRNQFLLVKIFLKDSNVVVKKVIL